MRNRANLTLFLGDVLGGVLARKFRSIVTVLATAIGVAALVLVEGLGATGAERVDSRFRDMQSRQIEAERSVDLGSDQILYSESYNAMKDAIAFGVDGRVRELDGVVAAGTFSQLGDFEIASPASRSWSSKTLTAPVLAVSPGFFDAISGNVTVGRVFDSGNDRRQESVVVVGDSLAERLSINHFHPGDSVRIAGQHFLLIGIVKDSDPRFSDSAIIPEGIARSWGHLQYPSQLLVLTEPGMPIPVAKALGLVVSPADPTLIQTNVAPSPAALRALVKADLRNLLGVLGVIALGIGALSISSTTLLGVVERTAEIGLRRALGATSAHIGRQFFTEALILGSSGGVIGTAIAAFVVVAISFSKGWTPTVPPRLLVIGPLVGALVGVIAGAYPSRKAALIEPIEALRHD